MSQTSSSGSEEPEGLLTEAQYLQLELGAALARPNSYVPVRPARHTGRGRADAQTQRA